MTKDETKQNHFSARPFKIGILLLVLICPVALFIDDPARGQEPAQDKTDRKLPDPKAWGADHAGQSPPEYIQGDECLFCHRNDIGPGWPQNSHALTMRDRQAAPALDRLIKDERALSAIVAEIEFFLGSRNHIRFLKKEGYGKMAILETQVRLNADRQPERWTGLENPKWDKEKFANSCAGCHATAVDPETRAFSSFGLDCYTCHGNVTLKHTADTSLMLLSKKKRKDPKLITSICAQCHLRGGKSGSTGLPYPNNFIAGDNLFLDYQANFALADDQKLNPGDRHVWRNVRDVVLYGDDSITCLSCHQVHANTSIRHRRILRAPICSECHLPDTFKNAIKYEVHSALCEY